VVKNLGESLPTFARLRLHLETINRVSIRCLDMPDEDRPARSYERQTSDRTLEKEISNRVADATQVHVGDRL
jgi:hypothetical protein